MEFKELESKIAKVNKDYGERYGIKMDEEYAHHKLHEEVGEFAKAWMIYQRKCRPEKILSDNEAKELLGEELADIVGLAMMNAQMLGIDLEEAMRRKWLKYYKE